MFNKDFNEDTICPLLSTPDHTNGCQRDCCAIWLAQTNDDYSACSLFLIASKVKSLDYQMGTLANGNRAKRPRR